MSTEGRKSVLLLRRRQRYYKSKAEKFRAKKDKAASARAMFRRADQLLSGLEAVRKNDRVAKLRFPTPISLRQNSYNSFRVIKILWLT
jgi:hypothetical protein